MKTVKILLVLSAAAFMGCTMSRTYAKPQESFLPYNKIAVISFSNPKDAPTGQEAADIVALEFTNHGFAVVGSSQLTALIEQSELYNTGLTPDIKAKLQQSGIEAVVLGRINEYHCSNTDTAPTAWNITRKTICTVTLTTQMVDINSGEILWGTTVADSHEGQGLTAKRVLISLTKKIDCTIPNAPQKAPAKK
jgi:curli biogenesis system outer membrane secretion channel CsgG